MPLQVVEYSVSAYWIAYAKGPDTEVLDREAPDKDLVVISRWECTA